MMEALRGRLPPQGEDRRLIGSRMDIVGLLLMVIPMERGSALALSVRFAAYARAVDAAVMPARAMTAPTAAVV